MGWGGTGGFLRNSFFTLASSASGRHVARVGIVEQMDLSEKRQVIGRGQIILSGARGKDM